MLFLLFLFIQGLKGSIGIIEGNSIEYNITEANIDGFGRSVSLYEDYALIGSTGTEVASIYHLDGTNWTFQQFLNASDQITGFGYNTIINGNFSFVSAFDEISGNQLNSVFFFVFNGTHWNQQQKINNGNKYFGFSMSYSHPWLFISDRGYESIGACFVYKYNGTHWDYHSILQQKHAEVVSHANFGESLDVYGDKAIIGETGYPEEGYYTYGRVYFYHLNETEDWELDYYYEGEKGSFTGKSISIFENNVIVRNSLSTGSVNFFRHNGTAWEFVKKIVPNDAVSGDQFGKGVELHKNRFISSAFYSSNNYIYVFEYDGEDWYQIEKINPIFTYSNFGIYDSRIILGRGNQQVLILETTTCNQKQEGGCGNTTTQGYCSDQDVCSCFSGNKGNEPYDCLSFSCDGLNECSGNGNCIESNQCNCSDAWHGDECSQCDVVNRKNMGECVFGECREEWSGDLCDQCDVINRANLSQCITSSECFDEFFGEKCDQCNVINPLNLSECHSGMDCKDNWSDDNCNTCTMIHPKNGTCESNLCIDEFTGDSCEECPVENPKEGTCVKGECSNDWSGDLCDQCTIINPKNGTCKSGECEGIWSGDSCDICPVINREKDENCVLGECSDDWNGDYCNITSSSSSVNAGALVGGIVGGVFGVLIIIIVVLIIVAAVFFLVKKKSTNKVSNVEMENVEK